MGKPKRASAIEKICQVDYTGRSTTNIKAQETVNSLFALKLNPTKLGHACKNVPLQISIKLRTGRREPVDSLQRVLEMNFGQRKIKLAAMGQSGI